MSTGCLIENQGQPRAGERAINPPRPTRDKRYLTCYILIGLVGAAFVAAGVGGLNGKFTLIGRMQDLPINFFSITLGSFVVGGAGYTSSLSLSLPVQPSKKPVTKEVLEKLYAELFNIKNRFQLSVAASSFFENYDVHSNTTLLRDFSYLGEEASDEDILNEFSQYEGFGVGEIHDNDASKVFFMKNIPMMVENGVRTLLFEGISYKDQPLLDKWCRREALTPCETARLNEIFSDISNFKYNPEGNNDFTVLLKAREYGMRIVGIDYNHHPSFSDTIKIPSKRRRAMMNYVAYLVAQHEMNGKEKFVALMGLGHLITVKNSSNVPGFAELMGCPCVEIFDSPKGSRQVAYNQEKSNFDNDPFVNPLHISVSCPKTSKAE